MITELTKKINVYHLKKDAYIYVRQSTIRQVIENRESTKRQYALKDRVAALGWSLEQIKTIDCDLGQSGSGTANREGFKKLVAEVGMGNAGIVAGLEVSRLARNSSDWHRLLEICAVTNTLLLDEDGIYSPENFNDRLLLGLKGTMSEAELHYIRARMLGGIISKAKRGELKIPLPIGFVYNDRNKIIVDPDRQVQESIKLLFKVFKQTGSAFGTVKYFKNNNLKFPRRVHQGINKGDLIWDVLETSKVRQILHNHHYAGIYSYGKNKVYKLPDGGKRYENLPQDQWIAYKENAHASYISYEEFEENSRILKINAQSYGADRRNGPPREGSALLQGIVLCGICGKKMYTQYRIRKAGEVRTDPIYICEYNHIKKGDDCCQRIEGKYIDKAIGEKLINSFTPLTLEVALNVQDELKKRHEQIDKLRKEELERARYEVNLARRRYMHVDPENRLVADSLEAEWNEKLVSLNELYANYEKQKKNDFNSLNNDERNKILSLATDFPALWNNQNTSNKDKKRMIRLLIEDVTLTRNKDRSINVDIRFKGGANESMLLPAPIKVNDLYQTDKEVVQLIDQLLEHYTFKEIADILNNQEKKSGKGLSFNQNIVENICRRSLLSSPIERLMKKNNLFRVSEVSKILKVSKDMVRHYIKTGIIIKYKCNVKKIYFCKLDYDNMQKRLSELYQNKRILRKSYDKLRKRINEVQYAI
jgi:DNA invertase Pin-like site-specific DNA recombinase